MPKGLANLMTHAEFVDLVRFLSELGRPGPYAIRTTPTIQRWRVLKAVPPRLAEAVPDAETLRDQVLHLPPDRWGTVYARVSGSLPLDEAVRSPAAARSSTSRANSTSPRRGTIRICPAFPEAIRFWVDDVPAPIGTREFSHQRDAGPPRRDPPRRERRTDASRDPDTVPQAVGLDRRVHGPAASDVGPCPGRLGRISFYPFCLLT